MQTRRTGRTVIGKNTRTEVMAPRDTRRRRTRGDQIRDAIRQFEDDVDDALDIFPEPSR